MHVILNLQREIVHEHERDAGDVQTARGDVRGHQEGRLTLPEEVQAVLALGLILVAVDGARASKPRGFDLPIDEIASTFGAAEDDAARAVHDVFLEHRHRAIELLFLFDHFHRLRDGFIRRQSLAAVADAHAAPRPPA